MDDAATVANSPSLVLRVCERVHLNATLNTQRCSLANPHLSITVLHPIITFKETIFSYRSSDMVLPSNCCCTCVGIFSPHCYFSSQYFWACIVCCCREEPQFESFSFQPYSESSCVQRVQEWTKRHRQLPLRIFSPLQSTEGFSTKEKKQNKGRWGHFLITSHLSPQCLHSFYDITCTSCKSSPARHPANTAAVRTYIM